MLTKSNPLAALDGLPLEARNLVLAFGVVLERIRQLPPADRDDLYELAAELRKEQSDEDRQSVFDAMHEILLQTPITASQEQLTSPAAGIGRGVRKKWAAHVGKAVKKLREAADLSQEELAAKAGIPQSHLSRVETAAVSATHKTLKKLANALGVEVRTIDPCLE